MDSTTLAVLLNPLIFTFEFVYSECYSKSSKEYKTLGEYLQVYKELLSKMRYNPQKNLGISEVEKKAIEAAKQSGEYVLQFLNVDNTDDVEIIRTIVKMKPALKVAVEVSISYLQELQAKAN